MPMFGVRKALMLLAGAGAAGVLVWVATQVMGTTIGSAGEYWAVMGLLAAAGFVLAALHMLGRAGGGMAPHLSPTAFVLGFLPVLVVGGFIVWYGQPSGGWLVGDTHSFASNIGVGGLVSDLTRLLPVFPLGVGLVLGLTFDALPRPVVAERRRDTAMAPAAQTANGRRGDRAPARTPSRTRTSSYAGNGQTGPTHPLSRDRVEA
jgi:hypothetical protein